ncbi:hypothetical protein BJ741DRAFT_635586 [Chytriomyces cf. hyalinus JEL632]|nr:hypothetical protein BJ741DRAFT_635586 [Chytriomyces cf. hyalinus JEL632]
MLLVPLALVSLLLLLVSVLAVASLRKTLLLPLYHRVYAWQITSELLQLSWTSVPAPELVMSRAMALTQLDNLNEDGASGEKSRSDFIDPLYAALQDAWRRDDSTGALCLGVFRAFLLDCVTRDLGRRLVLMDVLTSNPSIASIRIPKLVVITGVPYSGTHVLRKYFENKHNYFVPSLESIESIESLEPRSKVAKNASFQETQFATLLKWFATKKERETHLANDSFRYACSIYLNCTLTALRALARFPLPSLTTALQGRSQKSDIQLLKRILQVQLFLYKKQHPQRQDPEYIVLEGHEHSVYLESLFSEFQSNVRVVSVECLGDLEFGPLSQKVFEQTKLLRELILGPHATACYETVHPISSETVRSELMATQLAVQKACASHEASVLKIGASSLGLVGGMDSSIDTNELVRRTGERVDQWLDSSFN